MVYKKFLILSFSFFSKPSIFWKRILAVGDRLWVWWLALFLELGWHVIVWCHIEILALCDKNTKRCLHSSWLKRKSKILLARAVPWPGQWPKDDLGNDRGDNLGVMESKKYMEKRRKTKKTQNEKRGCYVLHKSENLSERRIMRVAYMMPV